jgi:hypothetical protein
MINKTCHYLLTVMGYLGYIAITTLYIFINLIIIQIFLKILNTTLSPLEHIILITIQGICLIGMIYNKKNKTINNKIIHNLLTFFGHLGIVIFIFIFIGLSIFLNFCIIWILLEVNNNNIHILLSSLMTIIEGICLIGICYLKLIKDDDYSNNNDYHDISENIEEPLIF